MSQKNNNVLIVGGGILGLSISKFINKKKWKVTLINAEKNFGGMLSSIKVDNNFFDYGTHFIRETGHNKIDNILFKKIKREWINIKYLKSGSFYKNHIDEDNQFLNLKKLKRKKKIIDFLNRNKLKSRKFKNEYHRLKKTLGEDLSNIIYKKIVKLTDIDLKDAPINFVKKFNYSRINIGDSDLAYKLKKKNENLDKIVSFPKNTEGVSKNLNFYPKSGGIEKFVKYFKSKSVIYKKNTLIINIKKKKKYSVYFSNGEKISFDYIIWAVDKKTFPLLTKKKKEKLNLIYWKFYNITSNKKFKTNCYYINIFDDKTNFYRITLYNNIQSSKSTNRLSIEEITGKNLKKNRSIKYIKNYLLKMKLIDHKQHIQLQSNHVIPLKMSLKKRGGVNLKKFKNVFFVGKNFFEQKSQEHSIVSSFEKLKKFL